MRLQEHRFVTLHLSMCCVPTALVAAAWLGNSDDAFKIASSLTDTPVAGWPSPVAPRLLGASGDNAGALECVVRASGLSECRPSARRQSLRRRRLRTRPSSRAAGEAALGVNDRPAAVKGGATCSLTTRQLLACAEAEPPATLGSWSPASGTPKIWTGARCQRRMVFWAGSSSKILQQRVAVSRPADHTAAAAPTCSVIHALALPPKTQLAPPAWLQEWGGVVQPELVASGPDATTHVLCASKLPLTGKHAAGRLLGFAGWVARAGSVRWLAGGLGQQCVAYVAGL